MSLPAVGVEDDVPAAQPPRPGDHVKVGGTEVLIARGGRVFEACPRCGDFTGRISAYGHVLGGQCFGCQGTGLGKSYESLDAAEKDYAKRAKARDAAARRRAAKLEEETFQAREAFTAWKDANRELAETLAELADRWDPRSGAEEEPERGVDSWLYDAALAARRGAVPPHAETLPALLAEYHAKRAAKAETAYAGAAGEAVTVTGEVTLAMPIEGIYGTSMMIVLSNGPVTVKTYTTAKWARSASRGDTLTITGTVKSLDEYEGVKQTVLARPKAVAH